ncbi:MAG: low molecular weight protein-tyrosine-phosphatase [Planctomycetota bacterium]
MKNETPIRVLFVCLGNICRSPAAEGVFQHLVDQSELLVEIEVDSAGTSGYHIGEPADSRMRSAAGRRGIELTSRSRQVIPGDFSRFDMVVAMDRSNYQELVREAGTYDGKVRLMSEFLKGPDKDRFPEEVPDPYYGENDGFEFVLDMVQAASPGLLEALLER